MLTTGKNSNHLQIGNPMKLFLIILAIFRKAPKAPPFLYAFTIQKNIRACKDFMQLKACERMIERFIEDYGIEAKQFIKELISDLQWQSMSIQLGANNQLKSNNPQ